MSSEQNLGRLNLWGRKNIASPWHLFAILALALAFFAAFALRAAPALCLIRENFAKVIEFFPHLFAVCVALFLVGLDN